MLNFGWINKIRVVMIMSLVDHTLSHPATTWSQCEGIIVKFLFSNATSIVQLMDQLVIVSFKRNYQKNLVREILLNSHEANFTNSLKNITVKDIIFQAADAWNDMKLSFLRKAWCPFLDIMYEKDTTQNVSSEDENSLEKFL